MLHAGRGAVGLLGQQSVGVGFTLGLSSAREQIAGVISDDDLSVGCFENRQHADGFLSTADLVPGYPDAVRVAELGRAMVFLELFGGDDVFAVRLWLAFLLLVVVGVDRQLASDRHGLMFGIVEVQAAAESARGAAVGAVDNGLAPDRDQFLRFQTRIGFFLVIPRQQILGALGGCGGAFAQRLTAAPAEAGQQQQGAGGDGCFGGHTRSYRD